MILAKIALVDGGHAEMELPDAALETIARLQREGYMGRSIINRVLTDDWGAPPVYVDFVPADGGDAVRLSYRK